MPSSTATPHTPTPRPWKYQEESDAYTHILRSADGEFICQFLQDTSGKSEANARHIVQAVNSFDALVKAVKVAQEFFINPGAFNPLDVERLYESALKEAGIE